MVRAAKDAGTGSTQQADGDAVDALPKTRFTHGQARMIVASFALVTAVLASAFGKPRKPTLAEEAAADDTEDQELRITPQHWSQSEEERVFEHSLIGTVTTLNFNETVSNTGKSPLIVAFYDPRSVSFKDLRPHLEATAATLADRTAAGHPSGKLGACDMTVHTYLANQEAPQLMTAWQELKVGAFKFGKPRYLPMILMVYMNGERLREYTGVVKEDHISKFLTRIQTTRSGELLQDVAAARTFLAGPGPFAFSCGFSPGSREALTFDSAAHKLYGQMMFGKATTDVCEEAFEGLEPPWPMVVWAREGNSLAAPLALGVRSSADKDMLSNASMLVKWLFSHKLLEEMTPDNSHVFLDRQEPLVIFLLDTKDMQTRQFCEALVTDMDTAEAESFQFVWSDCRSFAAQFGVKGKCSIVVIVETATLDFKKIGLKTLKATSADQGKRKDKPWTEANRTTSSRLLVWMHHMATKWIAKWQPQQASAPRTENAAVESEGSSPEAGGHSSTASKEEGGVQPSDDPEWYLNAVPRVAEGGGRLPISRLFHGYHELLESMVALRESFNATYGSKGGTFDFKDLEVAQGLDPSMRLLAQTPEVIQAALKDERSMTRLWVSIEKRAAVLHGLNDTSPSAKQQAMASRLSQGYELLRGLFVRLYRELHARDRRGALGLPTGRLLQVERRAAEGLSVQEFLDRYARPRKPVIITGLRVSEEPWSLDLFKRLCNATPSLKTMNSSKRTWGRLQNVGRLPLAEFIDTFVANATRRKWYLHDWSLPQYCPEVFGPAPYQRFTMPKYFAGDYFQRASIQSYQHTWPSLFIGSDETESGMHVDSGGTHFWLQLLSGRKEWTSFSRGDLINTYRDPTGPHFYVDPFRYNDKHFPLTKYAERHEAVQEAGELMFIPAGSPHAVRNLEPIHGISMNYVDATNVGLHLWETMQDNRWAEFEAFTDGVTFPHGLRSDQQPMPFGEWKSTSWRQLKFDIA